MAGSGEDGAGRDRLRLRPEMASHRNLVLAFVRDYIARWRASPSYGEIAAGVGTSRMRVRDTVRALAADGHLLRTPGPRGLALPDDEAAAILRLQALGWRVTKSTLRDDDVLDYPGDDEPGGGGCGDQGAR